MLVRNSIEMLLSKPEYFIVILDTLIGKKQKKSKKVIKLNEAFFNLH